MAESPAHKFGQVIGELLESIVRPQLEKFCVDHNLYLDHQKNERAARPGLKVTWEDKYGNTHDLDFVIEREATDNKIGRPVAFIEVAWRRYTKHSRNKAQEIQGAILPLAEKYRWDSPFLGAVLAGEFTSGSIDQLRSLGFSVLYFPYESLVAAFHSENIEIQFDEDTPDSTFSKTTTKIEQLSPVELNRIKAHLVQANQTGITIFLTSLNDRIGRNVKRVIVIPLYGITNEFFSIEQAVAFLDKHLIYEGSAQFRKYEIQVEYSNGDSVHALLDSKDRAREFLTFVSVH